MAVFYEAGITKASAGAAIAIAGLFPNGTRRLEVRELAVSIGVIGASAPELIVGRAGNTPTVGVGVTGQPCDAADAAGTGILSSTWTTAPTIPANAMRRYVLPNVVGAAIIWTWGPGEMLIGPTTSTLIVWQVAAITVTYSIYAKWLE